MVDQLYPKPFDPALSQIGVNTITYTYTDSNNCVDSLSQFVDVVSVVIPEITFFPTLNELISSPASSYQWYNDGNIIGGETDSIYNPLISIDGEYTVVTTDTNGCISSSIFYYNISLDDVNLIDIGLYPNPTNGLLNIEILNNKDQWNIELYNSLGVFVQSSYIITKESQNKKLLDISQLPDGVYLIKLILKDETIISRIILSK